MASFGPSPETRQTLLIRLRDLQDSEAWGTFHAVYLPMIRRYCRSVGLQDADSEDVAQEVLTQVSKSIGTFDPDPQKGRFRGWLGKVVRSQISKVCARNKRAGRGVGGEESDGALGAIEGAAGDASWEGHFNAHLITAAMERIRPNFDEANWRAFELAWLKDRAAPEVAAELRMSVSAVYVAKSRVLKRLREEILALAEDIPHLGRDEG